MASDVTADSASSPRILPPFEDGELMWAAASYVFWPFLPIPMLLTARREEPYLRFHFVQSVVFGFLTTVAFALFTALIVFVYRTAGTPEGVGVGVLYVSLFGMWLLGLLFCFAWFMVFAWRAGRGDVFRVVFLGSVIERWVINGMRGPD